MESLRAWQQLSLRRLLAARPMPPGQAVSSSHVSLRSLRPPPLLSRAPQARPFTSFRHTFRPKFQSPRSFLRLKKPPRRLQSTQAEATSEANLSLSARMKKLSREYGWSAVGVYLLLSALDLPFCLLAVRLVGVDKIGHWEHVVMSYVKGVLNWPIQGTLEPAPIEEPLERTRILEEDSEMYAVEDHGYDEAEKANQGDNASKFARDV